MWIIGKVWIGDETNRSRLSAKNCKKHFQHLELKSILLSGHKLSGILGWSHKLACRVCNFTQQGSLLDRNVLIWRINEECMVKIRVNVTGIDKYPPKKLMSRFGLLSLLRCAIFLVWFYNISCLVLQYFLFGSTIFLWFYNISLVLHYFFFGLLSLLSRAIFIARVEFSAMRQANRLRLK